MSYFQGLSVFAISDDGDHNKSMEEIEDQILSLRKVFRVTYADGRTSNIVAPFAWMQILVSNSVHMMMRYNPEYEPISKATMDRNDRLIAMYDYLDSGGVDMDRLRAQDILIHRSLADKAPVTRIGDRRRLSLCDNLLILHAWTDLKEGGKLRMRVETEENDKQRKAWMEKFRQSLPNTAPRFELYHDDKDGFLTCDEYEVVTREIVYLEDEGKPDHESLEWHLSCGHSVPDDQRFGSSRKDGVGEKHDTATLNSHLRRHHTPAERSFGAESRPLDQQNEDGGEGGS
ncbi:hypothetical protein MMC28_002880 [Mycoblastus sanguinarius]|nr:hypothetical protein [Mycoblastus sanguinarius]